MNVETTSTIWKGMVSSARNNASQRAGVILLVVSPPRECHIRIKPAYLRTHRPHCSRSPGPLLPALTASVAVNYMNALHSSWDHHQEHASLHADEL